MVSFEVPHNVNYEANQANSTKTDNSSQILMNITRGKQVADTIERADATQINQARKNQIKMEL